MKHYRFLLPLLALAALAFPASIRAEDKWETDFKKAQEEAKSGHKLLFVNFTGSDWCGWCIKLDREIFSKPAFQDYANKNLVLLTIDFPRPGGAADKAQSDDLKKQNQQLADRFDIKGFPTIVVLNSQGRPVGELGYTEGGPSAFIAELEKIPKG